MRYFLIFLLLVALWLILDEFILQDRGSEGLNSIVDKLKDLGSRVHWSIGFLAVLIIVVLVLRFLFRVLASH